MITWDSCIRTVRYVFTEVGLGGAFTILVFWVLAVCHSLPVNEKKSTARCGAYGVEAWLSPVWPPSSECILCSYKYAFPVPNS
jgi:hypothetical protein